MANNPFSSNNYDLGVGDALGVSKETATDNLLREAYSTAHKCYICTNTPQYRVIPKQEKYNNALLQDGLYICKHCISLGALDPKQYGIRELQ